MDYSYLSMLMGSRLAKGGNRLINVLIVEDDQLVRKGLISAMPWSDFNMQVVGEAGNGKKALEFLEGNHVDLVLTDLNMPIMTGMEFMRIVRKKYPRIFIVILTLHQDFEYIQQALRLGAIDFITKVQLEKETFDAVLDRIHKRIIEETPSEHTYEQSALYEAEEMLAVYSSAEIKNASDVVDDSLKTRVKFHQIDRQVFLLFGSMVFINREELEAMFKHQEWVGMKVTEIKNQYKNQVHRILIDYKDRFLFYEEKGSASIHTKPIAVIEQEIANTHKHLYKIRKSMLDLKWVFSTEEFNRLLNKLFQYRLPPESIHQLISELVDEWKEQYSFIPSSIRMNIPEEFRHWKEVKTWLQEFKQTTIIRTDSRYAGEVVNSVLEAVKLLHNKLDESVTAEDISKEVGMSRSYFNKCFKDITGKSFHQYVKVVRMEKAKDMLKHTNESIYWIAEKTGYLDEKYFSRIFKEQTGMLPSEYRKNVRKVEK